MSEYKEPIRISANDPICSVSSIEGTVIGILFEKTGMEIKNAMLKRVSVITDKISSYESVIQTVKEFLQKKENEITEIEKLRIEKFNSKKAELAPIERIIEKALEKKRSMTKKLDENIDKEIGNKSVDFEKGFQEIDSSLTSVDDLIKNDSILKAKAVSTESMGYPGTSGPQGDEGNAWHITDNSGTGTLTVNSANLGIGNSGPSSSLMIYSTQEDRDRALSKMGTLRSRVSEYQIKINKIQFIIETLGEEKRRLELMSRNIDDQRAYKLDLNKLSAFGFEDVEVV